jgi:hypothetical protein
MNDLHVEGRVCSGCDGCAKGKGGDCGELHLNPICLYVTLME